MGSLHLDTPESIILWSGIAIMFILFGVSSCFRGWAKIEEVRRRNAQQSLDQTKAGQL